MLNHVGVEVWSKFGRRLVEVWSKFGRSLVEVWCRNLVEVLSNVPCVPLMYRTNLDQTSTLGGVEVWSKFRPHFDTGGSKFGRNFGQTSTPTSFKQYIYIYIYIYKHPSPMTLSPSCLLCFHFPLHCTSPVLSPHGISQGANVYTMVYGYTSEIPPGIPRRIPEIPWRIPWRIPSATKVYLEGHLQQQPWYIPWYTFDVHEIPWGTIGETTIP